MSESIKKCIFIIISFPKWAGLIPVRVDVVVIFLLEGLDSYRCTEQLENWRNLANLHMLKQ